MKVGYYTYFHTRNDTGAVFYVGKGKGCRATARNRNKMWSAIANKHGFSAQIAARWATEKEAFEHERFLIACFRDMGIKLTNMTDGGEGMSGTHHSDAHKELMRKKMTGRLFSEATRQRMSAAAKARKQREGARFWPSGATDEQIAAWQQKSSASQVGKVLSEEHRAKLSKSGKGRVSANKGKTFSAEHREKMSKAAKGRQKSPEHKAKIKAAHVARAERLKAEKAP